MPVKNSAKTYRLVSAATTNANLILAEKCTLHGMLFINTSGADKFVKIYDSKVAPVVGTTTPLITIPVLANNGSGITLEMGIGIESGLGIAITGAAGDADTTAVGAGDVIAQVFYREA